MCIFANISAPLARRQKTVWALLAATLPILSTPATAAPGTLAQSPLFLSSEVEPNIMFVIDDSGSMDWEVSTRDASNDGRFTGTQPDGSNPAGAGSVKHRDSDDDNSAECGFSDEDFYGYIYIVEFGSNTYGDGGNDCNTADDQAWRIRNSDFNPLYFDPNKVYTPWAGVDKDGNPFTNIDVTDAPNNPYDPSERIDLTEDNSNWTGSGRTTSDRDGDSQPDGFRYYTWQDLDNDGLFDNGEQTEHLVKNAHPTIQQNFANWFSYYRKREFVAKAAYGKVIAGAENTRMGLMTLHNNNSVNTAIAQLNSDPATGAKRDLLDALYSINSNGGTPLRSTFYKCGLYLECQSGSPFSTCPALSEANGGACQQNFSIVMTDGFYNGSFSGVGNRDGDNSSSWDSGSSGPFGDSYSNTLGDIAMYFYERDLSSLTNSVPIVPGLDEAQHQHMVTYTVGFGVNGTINNMPLNTNDPFTWPDPTATRLNRIDDLRHAAYNGRGKYLDARDPNTLQSSLEDALANIADRIGSAAAVTFNSGTLSANSVVYLSLFNSNRWSGQLLAYSLDGITGAISSNANWDAAEVLENRNLNTNPRTILTYDGSDGVAFQWSDLTIKQQADLCVGPESNGCSLNNGSISGSTGIAEARLDFLRGDRSNEGAGFGFRTRSKRLGDFVHSGPVFVGPPEQSWPDQAPFPTGSDSYSAFQQSAAKSRTKIVYIGANDGMLHGFNAETGEEELAYIPDSLFSTVNNQGLHYLADPGYVHRYYVDLEPLAGDVFIKTDLSQSAEAWHTVLIGGLRAGGKGYFALDVTDPSQFSESNADDIVMWEFTSADDDDLGHSYGVPPVIAMMENGRWAAITSDGYEDSGDGKAQLFIIYLDGGLDGVWTDGSGGTPVDYVKITTGSGSSSDRNGLASPAVVDLDGNGTVDRVYAGDLRGDMWAFDLSSSNDSSWDVAYFSGGGAPRPLFNGTSDQPITSRPVVISHPSVASASNNQPNTMVLFGTGQYLVSSDNSPGTTQAFYGVWDRGNMNRNTGHLVEQSLDLVDGNDDVRIISDLPVDYDAANGPRKFGWYVELPDNGERVVSNPAVRASNVFFNTMKPEPGECTYGGSGWLMSISIENGGSPDTTPFDLNDDEKVDENDMITISGGGPNGEDISVAAVGERVSEGLPTASAFLGNHQYTPNSSSSKGDDIDERNLEEILGPFSGRLSWEELINQ